MLYCYAKDKEFKNEKSVRLGLGVRAAEQERLGKNLQQ